MDQSALDRVLQQAIDAEIAAACGYRELARRVRRSDVREFLTALVAQEEQHREALERVRAGDLSLFASPGPSAEVLVAPSSEVVPGPEASMAQALLAAIDQEQLAFRRYTAFACEADDPGVRTLFEALARQEANHWRQLEEAYDRIIEDSAWSGG